MFEKFKEMSDTEKTKKFLTSCGEGDLDVVKYFLTSQDLKEKINIHAWDDYGFVLACDMGRLEVVKYLLTSHDLTEHSNIHGDKDNGFCWACDKNHLDIIQFLIFDMNIQMTKCISTYLKDMPNKPVENMFKLRELNENLNKELTSEKIKVKGIKV